MDLEGEECGSHSGSSPVQMQPDYLDGEGQDNSRSMPHSQQQEPDMDNCDWPIHEPDQHQDTIEDKYHIQHNVDAHSVYLAQNYTKHPIEMIWLKSEKLIEEDDDEEEEEEEEQQQQHKQQQQCGVEVEVGNGKRKHIEDKNHIQLNVDNQSVYLDHNYSKHPIEIIRIKPERLVEEDEEKEEQQQLGVEVEVRSGEIKQESDTCLQIESIYSLSSDRLNSDPSALEHIKVETEEVKEEHITFKTDNSDTLMQIEDISPDLISENYESGSVSSGLCIPYFDEREGSSSHRSVDATPGNTVMKDSEKIGNEVDLLIENARKNVIDAASDSELTKCQLCGEIFSSTRELNHHCRIHTAGKHACKFCNYKTTQKSTLITHLRIHTGIRPFSCDLCDYKATQKSNLITHLRTHTGEKPFSCDLCDYKATRKSHLIRHLKSHTGDRPFSCDFCDYKATQKSELITHLRTHTGERPFSCELCDYKATRKSNFIRHLNSHTGERHFGCDLCDYTAKQKSNLVRHLNSHTGERHFGCDLCDYKATQKSDLIIHLRTHTGERPFSCDLCDYKATQKSNLIEHLRRHTGERPFSCDLCDYKATQKSTLITHLKSHTGEKPFSCKLCDYKATRKSQVISHLKSHTEEKIMPSAVISVNTN